MIFKSSYKLSLSSVLIRIFGLILYFFYFIVIGIFALFFPKPYDLVFAILIILLLILLEVFIKLFINYTKVELDGDMLSYQNGMNKPIYLDVSKYRVTIQIIEKNHFVKEDFLGPVIGYNQVQHSNYILFLENQDESHRLKLKKFSHNDANNLYNLISKRCIMTNRQIEQAQFKNDYSYILNVINYYLSNLDKLQVVATMNNVESSYQVDNGTITYSVSNAKYIATSHGFQYLENNVDSDKELANVQQIITNVQRHIINVLQHYNITINFYNYISIETIGNVVNIKLQFKNSMLHHTLTYDTSTAKLMVFNGVSQYIFCLKI